MAQLKFISDLHFGHKNVMAYDNREFRSVEEHDQFLIDQWNSAVDIDDDVWLLGDISWHNATKTLEILRALNGNKHLCIGNHDIKFLRNADIRNEFVEIVHYKEIALPGDTGVVLSHYPIPCFNKHYYGWRHLYGHVHNSFEWHMMENIRYQMEALYSKPCNMINVGCMMPYMNYKPRTLEDVESRYAAYKNMLQTESEAL